MEFFKPFITGKVPEGLELIGYREVTKTAKDYTRIAAAKSSEMRYDDWVATKVYLLIKIKGCPEFEL